MTSVADYSGRRIDVSAFSNVREGGEVLLVQELAWQDNFGLICTGVQKIAQRVAIRLFTIAGSMGYLPKEGCKFLLDAMQGRFRSTVDVFASFAESRNDLIEEFMSEETAEDPDDERLDDLILLNVTLLPGSVNITVQVVTVAGVSRAVILPIPVVL